MSGHFDVLVIGGGQAGLAVGYYLSRQGQKFVILDDHRRIGDNWRKRYDSLRLFTPAKYDGLPGMAFPASAYAFPTARQVADYLECYATHMRLPVLNGVKADGLWRTSDGGFVVTAGEQRFTAEQVVIATGMHQLPSVPAFASQLDPGIRQFHSSEYRNPAQLAPGDVLVVGAGHSGADIALEVSSAHRTWLSGPVHGQISLDTDSWKARPLWWLLWFAAHHLLTARYPPVRGMEPAARGQGGPLLRVRLPQLAAAGVQHVNSRTTGVCGGLPVLDDGRVLTVANVIWCTGFRHGFGWIHVPVTGHHGWPRHERGVARGVPGLYFVGLPFQFSFSSMLVGGVTRDASYVAKRIASPRCRS